MTDLLTLVLDFKKEWVRNRNVLGPETDALIAARNALFKAAEELEQGGRNERREADGPAAE